MAQAKTRSKAKFLWIVGLLLVLALGAAYGVRGKLRGGEASEAARRLPANVGLVLFGRGALELGKQLADMAGSAARDPALRTLVEHLGEQVGFDLLSPSAWLATGIDPTRPWALAMTLYGADPEQWDVHVLVASRDDAALERATLNLYEKNATALSHEPRAGFTAHSTTSGVTFGVHEGWLALARSARPERPALDLVEAMLDGPEATLADEPGFRDALASAQDGWHVFGYAAPAAIELARLGTNGAASWSPAFAARGATLSARLTDRELTSRVSLLHQVGSGYASIRAGQLVTPLDARIPGEPVAVLRLQLDLLRAWELARSEGSATGHDFDAVTRRLREETGIDFVADVLTPLDGRITLLLLPRQDALATPIEIVAYAGVRDMAKLQAVFERSVPRIEQVPLTIDKTPSGTWYTTPDRVGVGLVREHLVLALGDPSRVREVIERGDRSFVSELQEPARAGLARDHSGFAFLDSVRSARLLDVAELDLDPAQRSAVRALRGLASSFRVEGDAWLLETIAYAPEQGFTKVMQEQLQKGFGSGVP
ncbi:MAG: hypothetical protein ABW217_05915 [Polyangiaceae bacterium]